MHIDEARELNRQVKIEKWEQQMNKSIKVLRSRLDFDITDKEAIEIVGIMNKYDIDLDFVPFYACKNGNDLINELGWLI